MWQGLKLSPISPGVKDNHGNFALDWAQSIKLLKWSSRLLSVKWVGGKVVYDDSLDCRDSQCVLVDGDPRFYSFGSQ